VQGEACSPRIAENICLTSSGAHFVVSRLDAAAGAVCAAVKRQRESLCNPQTNATELLATIEREGLTQGVAGLRQFFDSL
jgi:hypothetical protein